MSGVTYLTLPTGDSSHEAVEEALLRVAEEVGKQRPRDERWLSHRGDSVVIAAREFEYNASWDGVDVLTDVPVDRVVVTTYDDTVDSGSGRIFERLGDRFVEVGQYVGDMVDKTKVPDFFRFNYGIDPEYTYFAPDSFGTTEREDAQRDWPTTLERDESELPVSESELAAWFDSEMVDTGESYEMFEIEIPDKEEVFPVDPEDVEPLLDVDSYYHSVAALLGQMVDSVPEAVFDRLTSEDPAARRRAVRYVAAVDVVDPDRYDEFVAALQTVDAKTRLLVAPKLWATYPQENDTVPEPDCVEPLLALADDPTPEVRLAGVIGASDVIGRLLREVETGPKTDAVLDGLVEPFYEAYLSLLRDEDTRVREITYRLVGMKFYKRYGGVFEQTLIERLDFDRRWQIATAHAAVESDDDPALIETPRADYSFQGVLGGKNCRIREFGGTQPEEIDTETIATMTEYAYGTGRPGRTPVKRGLADLGFVRPGDVRGAVSEAVTVAEAGAPTAADLRLLATAADVVSEPVGSVEAELRDVLTEAPESDRAVFADYALARLPDCEHDLRLGTDNGSNGVEGEYGKLEKRRVQLLVDTVPTTAEQFLETLPDRIQDGYGEPGYRRSTIAEAVHAASTIDPRVVADALGELSQLLTDPAAVDPALATAVTHAAAAEPTALDGCVDEICSLLGHPESVVREAAATALVSVAGDDPQRIPPVARPLVETSAVALAPGELTRLCETDSTDVPTPDDWPFGVVAANDTDALELAVAATEPADFGEETANLVRETICADEVTGVDCLTELLTRRPDTTDRTDKEFTQNDKRRAISILDDIFELVADDSAGLTDERAGSAVAAVAELDPVSVTESIRNHYESVESFVSVVDPSTSEALREALDR